MPVRDVNPFAAGSIKAGDVEQHDGTVAAQALGYAPAFQTAAFRLLGGAGAVKKSEEEKKEHDSRDKHRGDPERSGHDRDAHRGDPHSSGRSRHNVNDPQRTAGQTRRSATQTAPTQHARTTVRPPAPRPVVAAQHTTAQRAAVRNFLSPQMKSAAPPVPPAFARTKAFAARAGAAVSRTASAVAAAPGAAKSVAAQAATQAVRATATKVGMQAAAATLAGGPAGIAVTAAVTVAQRLVPGPGLR